LKILPHLNRSGGNFFAFGEFIVQNSLNAWAGKIALAAKNWYKSKKI
jgi:hypothetical protein